MKRLNLTLISMLLIFCCGCQTLRLAPSEKIKQNAWLHLRTTQLASDMAKAQNASNELCGLAELSALQSQAFAVDAGMPEVMPTAFTAQEILTEGSFELAKDAVNDAGRRIDPWAAADGLFEFAIAVAALFGGAGAVKIASSLKTVRQKSNALKEIIEGNELFKQLNPQSAQAFKSAQARQSTDTKTIVSQLK